MKITKDQVLYVAALARLKLKPEEEEKFIGNMTDIINFADKLNELDVDGIQPTASALKIQNVYREDKREASYPREEILKNAPSQADGCFLVPKIVE